MARSAMFPEQPPIPCARCRNRDGPSKDVWPKRDAPPPSRAASGEAIECGVGEIQTLTGMIERSHVELIMRVGKLIIAKGKRRIALESLFEEPHCLEQIVTRIKNRLINQISGA